MYLRVLSFIERVLHGGMRCYLAIVMIMGCFFAPRVLFAAKKPICSLTALFVGAAFLVLLAVAMVAACLHNSAHQYSHARDNACDDVRDCAHGMSVHARPWRRVTQWLCVYKHFVAVVVVAVTIVFIVHISVICAAWFYSGWDVQEITNMGTPSRNYFSAYPNQIFLTGVFRMLAGLAGCIGIHPAYLFLLMCSSLCVNLSIALTALSAYKLMRPAYAYVVLFVAIMLIGYNPWFLIPYSDTFAMPFVIAPFFVMLHCHSRFARAFFVVFFVLIGMFIKPTVLFAGVSIGFVALTHLRTTAQVRTPRSSLNTRNPRGALLASGRRMFAGVLPQSSLLSKLMAVCLAACLAAGGAYTIKMRVCASIVPGLVSLDTNRVFGATHFLMMGTNPVSFGTFSQDDVDRSFTCPNVAARTAMNVHVWKTRVAELGSSGYLVLLARKSLSNYMDGTFGWNGEGCFVMEVKGTCAGILDWFGISNAAYHPEKSIIEPFSYLSQLVWFITLFGVMLCPYNRRGLPVLVSRAQDSTTSMMIALVMLSVFLMIFECRARYLFLYAPLFVLLATCGFAHLSSWCGLLCTAVRPFKKGACTHE